MHGCVPYCMGGGGGGGGGGLFCFVLFVLER